MLPAETTLVVLVVVELGMVIFDRLEEEVTGLFEERIDAEVEGVEIWAEWRESDLRIGFQ